MSKSEISKRDNGDDTTAELEARLVEARGNLVAAEAELAEEQAAVNAFRMHCRLKLDSWINSLQVLQAEKQSLKTRLELLRQAQDFGIRFDEQDPFWQGEEERSDGPSEDDEGGEDLPFGNGEDELILPTDVPRDRAAEKRLYRQLARRFHPDLGATAVEIAYRTDMMAAVNNAYTAHDIQALYDLAGRLDPAEAAALRAITRPDVRRLRQQILVCQQRRRRVTQQLKALRQENTARLWRKAQYLDRKDTHWWEIVRLEIERASDRVQQEITQLQVKVEALEARQIQDADDTREFD